MPEKNKPFSLAGNVCGAIHIVLVVSINLKNYCVFVWQTDKMRNNFEWDLCLDYEWFSCILSQLLHQTMPNHMALY